MGTSGHTLDMINRISQNREMLKSKRKKRAHIKELYLEKVNKVQYFNEEAKISPENLKRIKFEIRAELTRRNRINFAIALLILSITMIVVILLMVIILG